jgi:beta-lactamase class D
MNRLIVLLLAGIFLLPACRNEMSQNEGGQSDTLSLLPDSLGSYFTAEGLKGSFIALNLQSGQWYCFDSIDIRLQSSPASTFKIFNSLLAFEEGILSTASDTFRWDGVQRNRSEWNRDQSMQEAFRNSTVWFYQRIAERAGYEQMKYWIDACSYGNMDFSGGITEFWLSGALKISPLEQVQFIKRLMTDDLPFSGETMQKVRDLMILEQTEDYTLGAKTGWAYQDGVDIGWFTGFVKKRDGSVWIFATRLSPLGPLPATFPAARIDISRSFLRGLEVLP